MGEKIRLKDLEGDSDEIAKIFNSSGCSLSDYLNISRTVDIKDWHYWGAIVGFFIASLLVWTVPMEFQIWRKLLVIVQLIVMAVCVGLTHMRYKAKLITAISIFFGALIVLITLNVLTPQQAGDEIYRKGSIMFDKHI